MEIVIVGITLLVILGGFLIAGYILYRKNIKQILREQKEKQRFKNEVSAKEEQKFQQFLKEHHAFEK